MLNIFNSNTTVCAGVKELGEGSRGHVRGLHEGLLSAVSVGFFLVLVGALFIATPDLLHDVVTFFSHFNVYTVNATNVQIPAPENLGAYVDVYLAAREFSLVWGVFLIAMLGTRFLVGSPLRRKAENVGGIVFWLGATYLIETFLVVPAQTGVIDVTGWFEFWALIVALIGVSLIARAILVATVRAINK